MDSHVDDGFVGSS